MRVFFFLYSCLAEVSPGGEYGVFLFGLRYYVEAWLRDKETTTRPNTVKSYRDYANLHILPALGDVSVRDITWRTLQRLYEGLLKTHKVVTASMTLWLAGP